MALAHLRAMERVEAAGERFILINENIWFVDLGKILNEELSGKY